MSSKDKPGNEELNHITTGRFQRRMLMTKAGMTAGARIATDMYTGFWTGMLSGKDKRDAQRKKMLAEQANYLVDEMGRLKGSVVKIGQMMALYGEHLFPPEVTEALHRFETQTTFLNWGAIKSVLEDQLGERLNELQVEPQPIAAASLGQVHKAIRKSDGAEICLKVQYPGVADTVDSDIGDVVRIMKLAKLVTAGKEFDTLLDDVSAMLHREIDYTLEKETTNYFYNLLANDDRVIVPKVFAEYSTSKVLATSYEWGFSPNSEKVQELSQERRNKICLTFLEVFFEEVFRWHKMQADPNFGNYRVRPMKKGSDKLVLLDFGAVQDYPLSFIHPFQKMIRGAYFGNLDEIIEGAIPLNLLEDKHPPEVKRSFAEVCTILVEPFRYEEMAVPKEAITEYGYSWRLSGLPRRAAKEAVKKAVSLYFSVPPREFMFLSRKLLGVYTFVSVLDGQFNGRALIEKYLD